MLRAAVSAVAALTLALTGAVITSSPASAEEYDWAYDMNHDGTITIIALMAARGTEAVIPTTVQGMKVTAIGRGTETVRGLAGTSIRSVVIPDSVVAINDHAFEEVRLDSVTLGDAVTTIGDDAFRYTGLESVTIPDSVTTIGDRAFAHASFDSVTIPATVTRIGAEAFDWAAKEVTVVGTPEIGDGAFGGLGLRTLTFLSDAPASITTRAEADSLVRGSYDLTLRHYPDASGFDPAVWGGYHRVKELGPTELSMSLSPSVFPAGASTTVAVNGSDEYGHDFGDVTDTVALSSGVLSDVIDGDTITATEAGRRTVTATLDGVSTTATLGVDPAALNRLKVAPTNSTLTAGDEVGLTVTGADRYGNPVDTAAAALTSDIDNDVIDGHAVTATKAGEHTVAVTLDSMAATTTFTVAPARLDALTITQPKATIRAGDHARFAVTGTDRYGNPVDVDEATLTSNFHTDVFDGWTLTATEAGERSVTAVLDDVSTTTTTTVEPAAPARVDVDPAATAGGDIDTDVTIFIEQGDSIDFAFTAADEYGNAVVPDDVVLTSAVATDVIDGLTVTFPHASTHLITATIAGASTRVKVEVAPTPAKGADGPAADEKDGPAVDEKDGPPAEGENGPAPDGEDSPIAEGEDSPAPDQGPADLATDEQGTQTAAGQSIRTTNGPANPAPSRLSDTGGGLAGTLALGITALLTTAAGCVLLVLRKRQEPAMEHRRRPST